MFMFQTLKYLPAEILGIEGELVGIAAFGVGALVLVLIPFLDRRGAGRSSRLWTWAAYGALAYIIVLTILGYTASPEG
jgi:quinol-cytochrome oxidoreductase complex cytochrome b subunit